MYVFAVTVEVGSKVLGYVVQADSYEEVRSAMEYLHPGLTPAIQDLGKNVSPGVFKTWHEA